MNASSLKELVSNYTFGFQSVYVLYSRKHLQLSTGASKRVIQRIREVADKFDNN